MNSSLFLPSFILSSHFVTLLKLLVLLFLLLSRKHTLDTNTFINQLLVATMASIDSQSQTPSMEKVQLKVMFDKENNRVLWAEAGKDFADVLFSFLTLPLGTIARLVSQNSEPARIGSLSSLYQSMTDLKEQHLWSQTYKRPRNSMEAYCNKLKLNIDDTPMEYFFCGNSSCARRQSENALLSTFRNQKCSCGNTMEKEVSKDDLSLGNGFVKETASFIISDDLHVMQNSLEIGVHLIRKFGVQNIDAIEEQMVDISEKEVIDLLKLSFISKAPLTDLILKKKQFSTYYLENQSAFAVRKEAVNEVRKLSVKVTIRKSTREILLAEGEGDFADFILSFLTFPLGGVMHMLEASSSLTCLDNLYKSLTELDLEKLLLSNDLKDKLTKPQCFPKFELSNQILPIGVASLPVYYCHTYYYGGYNVNFEKEKGIKYPSIDYTVNFVPFKLVDPKFSISKSSGEFVTGPSLYMVTDDLVVTPMSSSSALSHLSKSKVSLSDIEQRVIEIGTNEGLSILKASLISTSALTIGLKQVISTVKMEN